MAILGIVQPTIQSGHGQVNAVDHFSQEIMMVKPNTDYVPLFRPHPKAKAKLFVIVPLILLGGLGGVFGFKKTQAPSAHTLTIIAKGDGTFDVEQIPDYWFAPTAVGSALDQAAETQFGKSTKADTVDVIVKADAGASDTAVCTAIQSARAHGYSRFGFTDERLSALAQQNITVADAPSAL